MQDKKAKIKSFERAGLIAIIFAIILAIAINALNTTSENYLQNVIMSDGGDNVTSENYHQDVVIGEISGVINSSNFVNRVGFFNTLSSDNVSFNVNLSVNATSPKRFESINITANVTDDTGLSLGQIIENQSGFNVIYNFTLSGLNAQFSQNITISVARDNAINITARATDTSQNSNENSTIIIVNNTLPPAPILISPNTNNNSINRTPTFVWGNVTDADNDSLLFNIEIVCVGCASDNRNSNVTNLNFTPSYGLQFLGDENYYYNWSVTAIDNSTNGETAFGTRSNVSNITIDSFVSLNLITSSIDFGVLQLGENKNTTDDDPPPFLIENDGNVFVNISIYANSSLFASAANPTDKFQYKVDNYTSELYSFDYFNINTTTQFSNFTSSGVLSIVNHSYEDSNDTVEIDIKAQVPLDEPAGTKTAGIVFEAIRSK
jgi:hypothetical protein